MDGKVYINDGQYFDHVNEADFGFFIGGYQPAQKWLKDRKGRTLTNADIDHYQAIILALSRAAPCGHFATLVRSIAAQSERLPSESFAFSGASRALMQKLSALSKEWLG